MFILKQTWWHIENKKHPSNSIVFTEVTDIYTDEQFIYYQIKEFFVGLKVRSRYKNHELNFIQRKDFIQINLGNLKTDWPPSNMCDENIRHVKVEIQYTDMNPNFENSFPRLGYKSTYDVDGITQPEFSITVPLGMKIRDTKKIRLLLKRENDDDRILHIEDVNIEQIDGKNSYNILLHDDSYNFILSLPSKDIDKNKIKVNYGVTNQLKFWFFPIFPVSMLIFGILEYFFDPTNYIKFPDIFIASLTYIIIFVTFLTFYLTMVKDGHEVPLNKFTISFTILSAIILIIPQLTPLLVNYVILPIYNFIVNLFFCITLLH